MHDWPLFAKDEPLLMLLTRSIAVSSYLLLAIIRHEFRARRCYYSNNVSGRVCFMFVPFDGSFGFSGIMNTQGKDTNTVLTNLSNYLTVVSDKPYSERKKQRYGLPALRSGVNTSNLGRRGLRPLHKTTLNLTSGETKSEFCSTMKDVRVWMLVLKAFRKLQHAVFIRMLNM